MALRSVEKKEKKFGPITVISAKGYNDGYYWDLRLDFRYKGKEFSFIDVGSGSGYIPCYTAIGYRAGEMLTGIWDEQFCEDALGVLEDQSGLSWLIDQAEKLMASADPVFVIHDETCDLDEG